MLFLPIGELAAAADGDDDFDFLLLFDVITGKKERADEELDSADVETRSVLGVNFEYRKAVRIMY